MTKQAWKEQNRQTRIAARRAEKQKSRLARWVSWRAKMKMLKEILASEKLVKLHASDTILSNVSQPT